MAEASEPNKPEQPQENDIGEFIKKLEKKGCLSLEQCFGADWEKKAVTDDFMVLMEKRVNGKILDISPSGESDPLSKDMTDLAKDLKSLGSYVDLITGQDDRGNLHYYFWTSRGIKNDDGKNVLTVHEFIDAEKCHFLSLTDKNSSVWAYDTQGIIFSFEDDLSGIQRTRYLDFNELNPVGKEYKPLFAEIRNLDEESRGRFSKNIAHADFSNYLGLSPLKNLDNVYSFLHEFGHLVYGDNFDWNKIQSLARKIFKKGLSDSENMTNSQARWLVRFDEKGAWDFCEKMVDWFRFEQHCEITITDRLIEIPKAVEESLFSYDRRENSDEDANPPAFSNLMTVLRRWYKENGKEYRFDPEFGYPISNCPILQIMAEGNYDKDELKDYLLRSGVIPESDIDALFLLFFK